MPGYEVRLGLVAEPQDPLRERLAWPGLGQASLSALLADPMTELLAAKLSAYLSMFLDSTEGGSEAELGLNQATKDVVRLTRLGVLTVGTAKVEDGGGDRDVVAYIELIPPFPGIVAILGGVAIAQVGGELGLTHSNTCGISFSESIGPLEG